MIPYLIREIGKFVTNIIMCITFKKISFITLYFVLFFSYDCWIFVILQDLYIFIKVEIPCHVNSMPASIDWILPYTLQTLGDSCDKDEVAYKGEEDCYRMRLQIKFVNEVDTLACSFYEYYT